MTLYMETTRIEAAKTAGEIQGLLAGTLSVTGIATQFADGEVTGLSFQIEVNGVPQVFKMPIRAEPVHRVLQQQRHPHNRAKSVERDREQAVRVAWRQVLRWIQAQIALIDTGMVDAGEVFLPYLQMPSGPTLYELAAERIMNGHPLLEAPRRSR